MKAVGVIEIDSKQRQLKANKPNDNIRLSELLYRPTYSLTIEKESQGYYS